MKRTIVSPCGVYFTPANPEVMYETDRRYLVWANMCCAYTIRRILGI
jgi:hypothetical protein